MNRKDLDYFEDKFQQLSQRIGTVHDDLIVIKTERKMEKKFTVAVAGAIALVVSTLTGLFWR